MFSQFNPEKDIDRLAKSTAEAVDEYVAPVRQTVFRRYPVIFSLLVTIGVVASFLGIERILLKFEWLQRYPEIILLLGVTILAFTGKLYKKLG